MGMSYMLQDFSTFPQLSVNDNCFWRYIFRKDRNLVKQRLEDVYDFFPVLRERKKKRQPTGVETLGMLSLGKEIYDKTEVANR
jgi:ABC-type branched-subunit amino acid transport system ATPase component